MREATSGITQRKLAEKHTGTVFKASSFRGLTRRASHKSSIANCRSSRRPRESPLPRVATSQTFVVAPIVVQSEEAQSSNWGCWPTFCQQWGETPRRRLAQSSLDSVTTSAVLPKAELERPVFSPMHSISVPELARPVAGWPSYRHYT